ncbi:MAG: DUF177 domain-containing protein [Legionella sp.]|nr:DUF177 domain-containing protein [Legionella sp.]
MLHLQELTNQREQTRTLLITERLPHFLLAPCVLNVAYQVKAEDDYYLIQLGVEGVFTIQCQRCLQDFSYPYTNKTCIAVCSTDERAASLLEYYECIVSSNNQVVLEELVIDELHLYAPQYHLDESECDIEVMQLLNGKNETY